MRPIPRLLPLAAIAIGGVLAVKTLAGIEVLPDALAGARAFAEEAAQEVKAKTSKAPKAGKGAQSSPKDAKEDESAEPELIKAAAPKPDGLPAAKPTAVCAPTAAELAKDAGLSPAELQMLQSLGTRRGQLDAREKDMDLQLKLLAAAEAKLDAKLKTMNSLKAEIQALIGEADKKEDSELDRLVTVYQKMKPREAAAVMVQLDDKVRIPVAAKMKEAALAAILAQMPPLEAKKVTELLAQRFASAKALAAQTAAPPAATPAAPAAAKAPAAKPAAKPATQAAAPAAAAPGGDKPKA